MNATREEMFWSKVDRTETCWIWIAGTNSNGYGRFYSNGHTFYAHRYSYEQVNSPIPTGFDIDHICRNRLCVNPDHLRAATRKENMENHSGRSLRSNHTSRIRGVTWSKRSRKWLVQVRHHGTRHYGGLFPNLDDARQAAIDLRNRLHSHNDADRANPET